MTGWLAAALIIGYLIGCLHGSVAARFISGVNIKTEGVKNSGASNAAIVLGWKYGALVAAIDIGKGAAAVLLMRGLFSGSGLSPEMLWIFLFFTGSAVVIGHNFPFYMGFSGGKGTAALIGVLLALDWRLGLTGLLLLIIVSLITDYLVIGVLCLYAVLLLAAFLPAQGEWPVITAAALFGMALWKHLENIKRIKEGTENKVSAVFRKKPAKAA
ncbi:glycerol-3-phosphate acyltransferase [Planococcus lenghuensis]|uniref:Glycerol-3-phosphate acyltransferase n=1 Tax=Planococcus lenghuensis TaxID=2213202 RepID=A0A1Q2L1T3_9BACL|nr:glycerol-3-phosphate acyltransferase [Planococcus lenghuensis]AQQ54399.1 glycerol-3-phosphate acyltransferase 1 [Planococcus lenghuensis]